jgi:N-acetylglucosaminyldiphosphoundecaprenol N-acetyl-beta-D-mannosaminyltransferase
MEDTVDRTSIFGRSIDRVGSRDISVLVDRLAARGGQSLYFCNVHMLMLAQEDATLAKAMDQADWVFADGVPVAWLQRRISGRQAEVIRGYEVMLAVCERAAERGEGVGLFGSTEPVMQALVENLRARFPALQVRYHRCPPQVEDGLQSGPQEMQAIRDADIRWLFVGLGCPKQEKWVAMHRNEMDCNVLAVGAAFDWLSGRVRKPPAWMERYALAWLYRLLQNPSRMWFRYLKYNTKFILRASRLLLGGQQA